VVVRAAVEIALISSEEQRVFRSMAPVFSRDLAEFSLTHRGTVGDRLAQFAK